MQQTSNLRLVHPQTGNLSFELERFESNSFSEIQKNNIYSLIWVQDGTGMVTADFTKYELQPNTLLSFSPHQPFVITSAMLSGWVIRFHPDFFCIHKHRKEVACNGVLFNNIYSPPILDVKEKARDNFKMVIDQIRTEMQNPALAQYELLVSYLKIFLITASRLKTEQQDMEEEQIKDEEPFILQNLKNYIELHYRSKHSASEYADLLAITPKALSKLTRTHFNKTPTSLISERIIIEAKRELYLTNKPVKQIAYELGYNDEYYFSRFFKKNAEVSPQVYRDTVGFDRAASA